MAAEDWSQAIHDYLTAHKGRRARRTLAEQERHLRAFSHWFGQPLASVLPVHLEEYLASHSQRVKLVTAWGYVLRLKRFFAWAAKTERILWNPAEKMKSPHFERPSRRLLGVAQVQQLLQHHPWGSRDATILEVFYGTGLRLEEVFRLDVSDVDLARQHLSVGCSKGGAPRLAPFGPHLQSVLTHYLENERPPSSDAALWLNYKGKRLSKVHLGTILRRTAQALGLGVVSPHHLRHAYATHLLEGGAPLRMVQVLLGHRTGQATQIYTHLVPAELFKEHRRTHPRARRRA